MPRALHRRTVLLTLALAPLAAAARPAAVRELLTAARRGDLAALHAALAAGAEVNGTDPRFRQTALMRAAMFGQAAAAQALLAAGADPERQGAPDGQRALHWAAVAGSVDTLRVMLAGRAAVDGTDGHQATPLDHALTAGQPDAVTVLLDAGADPRRLNRSIGFRIGGVLNPDTPANEFEAMRRAIASGRGLSGLSPTDEPGSALTALAHRANRPGAERLAADLLAVGAPLDSVDAQGRRPVRIIEEWLPRQPDARQRAQMMRVLQLLREAEARR